MYIFLIYVANCLQASLRQSQSCSQSTTGYHWNGQQCIQCQSPYCVCTKDTKCDSCLDLYYYDQNQQTCLRCPKGCRKCCQLSEITSIICTLCREEYFNINGVCKHIPGCTYFSQHGRCTTCNVGYYLDVTSMCSVCPNGCSSCFTKTYCTQCNPGYYQNFVAVDGTTSYTCSICGILNCNTCSSQTDCSACLPGYFLTSDDRGVPKCTQCMCNCAKCQNPILKPVVCFTCMAGYSLSQDQTQCQSCQDLNAHCLVCQMIANGLNNSYVCTVCNNGYYLSSESTCTACTTLDPNARRCNLGIITQCDSGYLLFNKACVKNIGNCATMNSTGCETCLTAGILQDKKCVTCEVLVPNCASCNDTQCVKCGPYYYLTSGRCQHCTQNCTSCNENGCTQCFDGYTYDSNSKTCSACSVLNCKVCSSTSVCTHCADNYGLINNKCIQCLDNCQQCDLDSHSCNVCDSGYYNSDKQCYPYNQNCLQANSDGFCYLCDTKIFATTDATFPDENDEIDFTSTCTQNQTTTNSTTNTTIEAESLFFKAIEGFCVSCGASESGSFDCPTQCKAPVVQHSLILSLLFIIYIQ